jgi:hypothetical protein
LKTTHQNTDINELLRSIEEVRNLCIKQKDEIVELKKGKFLFKKSAFFGATP